MSEQPGSDPFGDFQRWLMKAGARSITRDVTDRVKSTIGGNRAKSYSDVWDEATNSDPVEEPPECQWCPICRAARRARENGGSPAGFSEQVAGAADALAGLTKDAFSLFESAMRAQPTPRRPAGPSTTPAARPPAATPAAATPSTATPAPATPGAPSTPSAPAAPAPSASASPAPAASAPSTPPPAAPADTWGDATSAAAAGPDVMAAPAASPAAPAEPPAPTPPTPTSTAPNAEPTPTPVPAPAEPPAPPRPTMSTARDWDRSDDGTVVGPGVGWPTVVHPKHEHDEAPHEGGDRQEGGQPGDGGPDGGTDQQVEGSAE